jgi:hypothetical protein
VTGYVSGANVWGHGIANATGIIPNESIVLWVKNYCRAHPLERVEAGAMALVFELAKPPR